MVLPYIRGEAPPVRERWYRLFGFKDLSRFDASICNSDTGLVTNKILRCSTKSVSAEFFLYHLHIGCLKATIPYTPQTWRHELRSLCSAIRLCLTFQWGPCFLRPANQRGEFFHLLMKAGAVLEGFGEFCFAIGHATIICSDGRLPCGMSQGLCLNLCWGIVLFLRNWSERRIS